MVELATNTDFEQKTNSGLVLLDFYADWCGPCKMLLPVLEELSESIEGLKVVKVNVDNDPNLAQAFDVSSIPAFFLLQDGKVIKKDAGFKPKPLLEKWIKEV